MSSSVPPPRSPRVGAPATGARAPRLPGLTRRGAALALLGAAAGCTLDRPSGAASTATAPTTSGTGAAEADADTGALVDVTEQTAGLLALATATGRRHRELRSLTGPLAALHRAHAAVLAGASGASPTTAPSTAVRARPTAARAALLRAERDYREVLVGHARVAESGELARLFAAMNAGLAQRLDRRPDQSGSTR